MLIDFEGQKIRIRFYHRDLFRGKKQWKDQAEIDAWKASLKKARNRGVTLCLIEVWEDLRETAGWMSLPGVIGATTCGRREIGFNKETGRQFALVRALRSMDQLPGETERDSHRRTMDLQRRLIDAYLRSGDRRICKDLWDRGFESLYDAVFDPEDIWKDIEERRGWRQGHA